MEDEKLFAFLTTEIEFILKEGMKSGTSDQQRALENVARKAQFLQGVLACRGLSVIEVQKMQVPFGVKRTALEMFNQETLIQEILNNKLELSDE